MMSAELWNKLKIKPSAKIALGFSYIIYSCIGDCFLTQKADRFSRSAFKALLNKRRDYSASAFLRVLMHLAQT